MWLALCTHLLGIVGSSAYSVALGTLPLTVFAYHYVPFKDVAFVAMATIVDVM